MVVRGHIRNGVVVFDGQPELPEGAAVTVSCAEPAAASPAAKGRVDFPLVRSAHPGSVDLTSERITEILDGEDATS
jgi:hypothetical protein